MSALHLNPETIRAYRLRALAPEDLIAAGAHLVVCAECRSRVSTPDAESRAFEAFTGPHLRYEDLEALVKGARAADLQDHVAMCPPCKADLEDLRSMKLQRNTKSPRRYLLPAAVIAMAGTAILFVAVKLNTNPTPPVVAPLASLHDTDRTVLLDSTGQLRGISVSDPVLRADLMTALKSGQLTAASLDDLARTREHLLGAADNRPVPLRPLSPVGTVTSTSQPVFKWESAAGAIGFNVSVYDTNFNPVLTSPTVKGNEWKPGASLKPGETYIWTVTAHYDFKDVTAPRSPEPEARFRVASAADQQKIEAALAQHSDLLLAVEAAKAGAKDEASSALNRLAAKNPNSDLIERLRTSLNKK